MIAAMAATTPAADATMSPTITQLACLHSHSLLLQLIALVVAFD